ncbi:MAG TPA: hypothetical protein VNE61_02750 [Ktedonobacteraceae bacterium]|nr:hypothetical protein [Ktedonobacteraceae bacterium]
MQNQDQPGESFDSQRIVGRRSEGSNVDEINVYELREPFSSTSTASQQESQQKFHPPAARAFVFRRYPVISIALVALVIAIITLPLYFIVFGQNHSQLSKPKASGQNHSHPSRPKAVSSPTMFATPTYTTPLTNPSNHDPEAFLRLAMSGTPIYADTLTNPSNPETEFANWVQKNSPNNCFFARDGYHLQATGYSGCWESGYQFEDLALRVDVTLLSGMSAGVYCRFGTGLFGGYYGYLLGIDDGGNYWIDGGETVSQQPLFSPAIKQGYHVKNTLEIIAQGTTFYFFINGVFLTKLIDTNPTPTPTSAAAPASSPVPTPPPPQPYAGKIAFFANPAGTEAVFSNLMVYTLA